MKPITSKQFDKLSVGDRVIYIEENNRQNLVRGKTYEIAKLDGGCRTIRLRHDSPDAGWFFHRFALATKKIIE